MKVTWKITALVLAIAIAITGCNEDDGRIATVVQTSADYATRSNADYSLNTYGLVTAENAAKLITNWKTNKPVGKRNLYIMQFGNIYGFTGTHTEMTADGNITLGNGYIKSDEANGVYVFDRTSGCTDDGDFRFDGVTAMPKPVFTIQQMDQAFAYYGIDPDQDVIMLVLGSPKGESSKGEYMAGVARMWYTLTYWGFSQKSIMLLNGQASYVLDPTINTALASVGITSRDQIFTALPSNPPVNPVWKSISTVKVDGTILQATMKDMMNVVTLNSSSDLILDARSPEEYNGTKLSKTEFADCGPSHNEQCYTAFNGHMKGAKLLTFTDVLITNDNTISISDDNVSDYKDSSMKFKPLATLEGLFTAQGYTAGKNVYTYCRTGTKASLLSFTSAAVLGYKTRMYDGSWIQWGKLANKIDTYSNILVPAGNKWLTDVFSESVTYTQDKNVSAYQYVSKLRPAPYLNLDANDTNLIIYTDKLAK